VKLKAAIKKVHENSSYSVISIMTAIKRFTESEETIKLCIISTDEEIYNQIVNTCTAATVTSSLF